MVFGTEMFFVLSIVLCGRALADTIIIGSLEEFTTFSDNVSAGENYSGTTVILGNDIDFSSLNFEPVGRNSTSYFLGTFDGNGHVIRGIVKESSQQSARDYFGVFGYSLGATIRNLVVDASCKFELRMYDGQSSFYGSGIIGRCDAVQGPCVVDNCVSGAKVSFSGKSLGSDVNLGGISGCMSTSNFGAGVSNCVNFGTVSRFFNEQGGEEEEAFVGGIFGRVFNSVFVVVVKNCANYGIVERNGDNKQRFVSLGGIAGYGQGVTALNCLNSEKIRVVGNAESRVAGGIFGISSNSSTENCVNSGEAISNYGISGGILGDAWNFTTEIKHSFWTSNLGYGNETRGGSVEIVESSLIQLNESTLEELNSYSTSNRWNKWLFNQNQSNATINVGGVDLYSLMNELILLPEPEVDDAKRYSWFKEGYEEVYDPLIITSNATLYGGWSYIITFDDKLGTVATKYVKEGNTVQPPGVSPRTGYTFVGWSETDGGSVVSSDRFGNIISDKTFYACWTANTYTVIFDKNGGNTPSKTIMSVTYDSTYGTLATVTRTGYTFIGWFDNENEGRKIEATSKVNTTNDHILYAHWAPNNYSVTFDPNGGDELESPTKIVTYDEVYGDLPEPTRTGYTFIGWFDNENERRKIEATSKVSTTNDHTLYAHWAPNNYTVTFIFDNGAAPETRTLAYNESIIYPEEPQMPWFIFDGWDSTVEFMPAHNLTIGALWKANATASAYVEIVFSGKVAESEAMREISRFTDGNYSIVKFDYDSGSGSTVVIVKFVDQAQSEQFVRDVTKSGREVNIMVRFVQESGLSFSLSSTPLSFSKYLIILIYIC